MRYMEGGLKMITAVAIVFVVALGMATESGAINYYVDAISGNDSYDGMSPALPWKTISKVNSTLFQPGDNILFKCGVLWREQLVPSSSGTAGSPITYGSYGSGVKPVISGADIVSGLPYMINDNFTRNSLKGWVPGCGTTVADNDRLQVTIDNVENTSGDYVMKDCPAVKDAWLTYRFYAVSGHSWDVNMRLYLDDVSYSNRPVEATGKSAWQSTGIRGRDGTAIYMGSLFFDSTTLYENGRALKKVAWATDLPTTAATMRKGTWTIDTANWRVYIAPSAGGLPDANAYEASTRPTSIFVDSKNYTKYQDLELKNSEMESFYFRKVAGLEINDVVAHHNGSQRSTVQGQTATDVYIHNSIFHDSAWNGVSIDCTYGPSSNITIENNIVYDNAFNGLDFKALGDYTYSNVTVTGNRIYKNGRHGLYMQNYASGGVDNSTIAQNLFYRNKGAGVLIHKIFTGREHTGVKIYGNTFAYNGAAGGYGPGLELDAVYSEIKDNDFFTNSVTSVFNSEYRVAGWSDISDYNNSFDRTRGTNLYYNGVRYNFPAFQELGFEKHGLSTNPRFNDEFFNDYTLKWNSPLIDAGTTVPDRTTDIIGNPIYGPPDMGAFEYQPPYRIGLNRPDITGNVRIYADGKFRNTAKPSGNVADLMVAPFGGFGTGKYDVWMDIVISVWQKSGGYRKNWRESSPSYSYPVSIVHEVGDLAPNTYYTVAVDSVVGSGISGMTCSAGICLSDSHGKITFTYSGTTTGDFHTFSIAAP